jgi:hypothetical protein
MDRVLITWIGSRLFNSEKSCGFVPLNFQTVYKASVGNFPHYNYRLAYSGLRTPHSAPSRRRQTCCVREYVAISRKAVTALAGMFDRIFGAYSSGVVLKSSDRVENQALISLSGY